MTSLLLIIILLLFYFNCVKTSSLPTSCIRINYCQNPLNPCTSQGTTECVSNLDIKTNYTCNCQPGYTNNGTNSQCIGSCALLSPCGDNGVCIDTLVGPSYYSCNCTFGWTGTQCMDSYPTALQSTALLVGTGAISTGHQGWSVAISTDGTTVASGAPFDNSAVGAIWIFVNNGTGFNQQGSKLIETDTVSSHLGQSVAISGDGNTIATGGNQAVVFVRNSTGYWNQQGPRILTSAQNEVNTFAPIYVALSADGNTLAAGDYTANSNNGATYVFTRNSSGIWSQQGSALVGTGATDDSFGTQVDQGVYVALSADGNTLATSADRDYNNGQYGAVWIFIRVNNQTWIQQGNKLFNQQYQNGYFIYILRLSSDGNTFMLGSPTITGSPKYVYSFVRDMFGNWSQCDSKIQAIGLTSGNSLFGTAISISPHNDVLAIGDNIDNSHIGSVFIFTSNGTCNWVQAESKLLSGVIGRFLFGYSVSLSSNGIMAVGVSQATFTGPTGFMIAVGPSLDTCADLSPCRNGASCTDTQISPGYICNCLFGYYGYNCSTLNQCLLPSNPCQNGASCTSSLNNYTCNCIPGYSGRNCSVYDACSLGPCGDNGVCTDTLTGPNYYSCNCTFGWTGLQCSDSYPTTFQNRVLLSGTGATTTSVHQGSSVAISADVTTLVSGAPNDNTNTGAIWIFVNNGTGFNQQGPKLIETDIVSTQLGSVVAISGDGNTVVASGNTGTIAFIRNGTNWSQQGPRIYISAGNLLSIALSTDGNTLVVGDSTVNSANGATYVFTRNSSGNWNQQGPYLFGTGATDNVGGTQVNQGGMVAVSADGNTLATSAFVDYNNGQNGAVWIFIRVNQTWFQQGNKLFPQQYISGASYYVISLSGDGNTFVLGASGLLNPKYAFPFARDSFGNWSQCEGSIQATGRTDVNSRFGGAISLSPRNDVLAISDYADNGGLGSVFVFILNGTCNWIQAEPRFLSGITGRSEFGFSVSLSSNGIMAVGIPLGGTNPTGAMIFVGPAMDTCADLSPCQNGASCTDIQISPGYLCSCTTGWFGTNCTLNQCIIPSNPCQNGASCTSSFNNYTCNCLSGYSGKNCSVYDACLLGPCGDNGVCTDTLVGPNYYSCNCTFGWTGSQCMDPYPIAMQNKVLLTGTGTIGSIEQQGWAVAISADGTTVALGGPRDNTNVGAVWIFVNNGTGFNQQGLKLIETDTVSTLFGYFVAISGDGNTVATSGETGTVVFVRNSTGYWSQQGPRIYIPAALVPSSVALSTDGNTLAVGDYTVGGNAGATYVFTRNSNGIWSQQGPSLFGTGAIDNTGGNQVDQGQNVALSSDGNTLAISAGEDFNGGQQFGAVWIFIRVNNQTWIQQGNKLVPQQNIADNFWILSLSGDGNTFLLSSQSLATTKYVFSFVRDIFGNWSQCGGNIQATGITVSNNRFGGAISISPRNDVVAISDYNDNTGLGSVFIFILNGTCNWVQAGTRLITGITGHSMFGYSVSLSSNGIMAGGLPQAAGGGSTGFMIAV